VTQYLVELYLPGRDAAALEDAAARARSVVHGPAGRGKQARYLRTIFVPGDEMCFHLFEAASPDAVAEAIDGAGISYERIMPAITVEKRAAPHGRENV
jgi:hypothetical protein